MESGCSGVVTATPPHFFYEGYVDNRVEAQEPLTSSGGGSEFRSTRCALDPDSRASLATATHTRQLRGEGAFFDCCRLMMSGPTRQIRARSRRGRIAPVWPPKSLFSDDPYDDPIAGGGLKTHEPGDDVVGRTPRSALAGPGRLPGTVAVLRIELGLKRECGSATAR